VLPRCAAGHIDTFTKTPVLASRPTMLALVPVAASVGAKPSTHSRRALIAIIVAPVATLAPIRASRAAPLVGDYIQDTSAMLKYQRTLLRDGAGDVDEYQAFAKEYFPRYKFDHKGHTNSFAQVMNNDVIVASQKAYVDEKGLQWSESPMPGSGTPKGKMLDGYLANGERCVVKEQYPAFNAMDVATRAEWKAIECTQGLVKPE